MKKLIICLALFGLCALPVSAAQVGAGETYWLGQDQSVSENLYIAFGYVDISGNIEKDLLAAGGNVLVTGNVQGDAMIAGGTIDIWGEIGGDLRVVGGKVLIGNNVGGDIVAAGGMVQIRPGVKVGGDIIVAGGAVIISGEIGGSVKVAAGSLTINGAQIAGDVQARVDEEMEIGDMVEIRGDLEYSAWEGEEIPAGVVKGIITFNEIKPGEKAAVKPFKKDFEKPWGMIIAGIFAALIFKLILLIVAALFAVLVFAKKSKELVDHTLNNFGWGILQGLLIFIIAPIVIGLLFISVIGVYLGIFAGLVYGLLLLAAKVFAGIVLGSLIFKSIKKTKTLEVNWKSALVGIVIAQVISFIPILGWLFCAVFMLAALGSVSYLVYQYYWVKRA